VDTDNDPTPPTVSMQVDSHQGQHQQEGHPTPTARPPHHSLVQGVTVGPSGGQQCHAGWVDTDNDPTPPTASMQVNSHQRQHQQEGHPTPTARPPHHSLVQGAPLAHLVDNNAMQDGWIPTTIRHHQRHPCRWTTTKDSTNKKAIQHHSKATPSLAGSRCAIGRFGGQHRHAGRVDMTNEGHPNL
jgi:hypothetical protein